MSSGVLSIFTSFQNYIKEEQNMKDDIGSIVNQLESCAHEIVTVLQGIHQDGSESAIRLCCEKARHLLENDVKLHYKKLSSLLGSQSLSWYYKYHEQWSFVTQEMAFIVCLVIFLECGILATHEQVAQILDVCPKRTDGFHLDLVDYLMGVLLLASELSRFAVNSVTYGDFNRPVQISKFVTELNAGFTLLNLKNDFLRKRFDGLKYDMKKIEEVVYDLHIRGLIKKE